MTRTPTHRAFVSLGAALCVSAGGAAQQEAEPEALAPEVAAAQPAEKPAPEHRSAENAALENEMTPEMPAAISRAFEALAAMQAEDGSWGGVRFERHVGITALACLAFMSDGHLPGRGVYAKQVERGLKFVLDSVTDTGLIAAETGHGPMYGHGFAALFLGEVYGMMGGGPNTPESTRLYEALVKACRLIVETQNDEGGWRYNPVPADADISVTICQVMALRAAFNIGIGGQPSQQALARAVEYVRRCVSENGSVGYTPGSSWGASGIDGVPRAAAAAMSLIGSGFTDEADVSLGPVLKFLRQHVKGHVKSTSHWYWYGQYYAAQAMFHSPKQTDWDDYWAVVEPTVIGYQDADGNWSRPDNQGGSFATSMALIILQIPNNYLPIFQR